MTAREALPKIRDRRNHTVRLAAAATDLRDKSRLYAVAADLSDRIVELQAEIDNERIAA